ncbi:alpha/beta hydrolase [Algimonas porphyrae]|uniref:AB hydrolase-1 domain-containing protein n=1 Tax=Algimonas porphyrae TaxID=1128113 RepID=A0ABQ5UZV8_9PROT|nr:alpha/beta fold hydrolase [Algimonas porphyrae]GLQ20716.1 hypothetical protein GCM10007854_16710 [Algimonas porphyrae]
MSERQRPRQYRPGFFAASVMSLTALMLSACSEGPSAVDTASEEMMADAPAAEADAPTEVSAPAVARTDRELTVNNLAGSFRSAGDGAPAILIVPGSGPTDRDGNNPMAGPTQTYQLLADGLQDAGISSLRIDKRGMFGSAGAGDPNAVSVDIYAQDYRDWAGLLREESGNDCVYLLGHSEGGLMVSAAATQMDEGLCGVILVASPGRMLGDVLREQLRANPANAPLLPNALSTIDSLEAGDSVDVSGMHPALQGLFNPMVQDFLKSMFATDPATLVAAIDAPVLVVQGEHDIQVTVEDAQRLADAGAELVVLPGVNHILKDAPADRGGNLATYADPDLPLADSVVPAIAAFVKG